MPFPLSAAIPPVVQFRAGALRRLRAAWLLLGVALLAIIGSGRVAAAEATFGALPVTVTQVSDTALTLDSNSPTSAGPRAMYVSYRVTNTSAASVADLTATITGFSAGVTLGGGQTAAQYVGTLAAGESRTLFWFVTYPGTIGTRNVLTVNVTDGAGGTASGSGAVTTTAMLSSAGGGQTSSASIGPGAVVGQLIPLDVTFAFKSWKAGATFNLQPAGNADFPGGCFQLVSNAVISADNNLDQVIVPGTTNQTLFVAPVASRGGGSTWNVVVRYTFKYLCAGTSATPLPYSNELSGTQLKYSANYGTGGGVPAPIPPAPSPAASFTFGKTARAVQLPTGGSETYTITIANTSTFDVTIDSIRDVLPAGISYAGLAAGSGVTAANSSAVPAAGATGTIVWRGTPGSSYAIAAGGSLNLIYTTTVTTTAGQYVNSAGAYVGSTSIGSGTATVTVGTADVAVNKTGPTTAASLDTLKYLLTVTNAGPATAYQIVVRDTLPAGVTFVRATNGGTLTGGVVTWPAATSLAVGSSLTDSVLVLAPNTRVTLVNRGSATSASYDPAAANNDGTASTTQASTTLTIAVNVSPKGPATPRRQVPGKYAQSFTVSNVSVFSGSYHLLAARSGTPTFVQIDSIRGPSITTQARPDSAVVSIAARTSASYLVWYTIPVGDTATNTEVLRARHTADATIADTGWTQLRRSFPALTMVKTVSPSGVVSPGVDLTYTMSFNNTGEFAASAVEVSDMVPAGVYFKLASSTSSLPSGISAALSYSNDGGATWTYAPTSGGCSAPSGYDGCVNKVRWTLSQVLEPSATQSSVAFVARIR